MSRNKLVLLVILCCALVALVACGGGNKSAEAPAASAPAAAPAAGAAPAASTGDAGVSGTITFKGADDDTEIKMNADPVCAGLHKTPVDTNNINTKDGKLADVFVYVKSGLEGKTVPPTAEAKFLDQQCCLYQPKVFGNQVGQKLTIQNSDPTLHNIHALPAKNTEFNQGQPFQNAKFDKTFDKPEVLMHFKCDVHPWMSSYVGIVDNPFYAVSDESGAFNISKLPAGKYTIEAVHPTLGTKTQEVTLTPGQTATVSFEFSK
jgi:plastocyanin